MDEIRCLLFPWELEREGLIAIVGRFFVKDPNPGASTRHHKGLY
jgi:hypothetical protein